MVYFTRSKLCHSLPSPFTSTSVTRPNRRTRSAAGPPFHLASPSLDPKDTAPLRRTRSHQVSYAELSTFSSDSTLKSFPSTIDTPTGTEHHEAYRPSEEEEEDLDAEEDDESASESSKTRASTPLSEPPSDLRDEGDNLDLGSPSSSTASARSFDSGRATNNDNPSDPPSSPMNVFAWLTEDVADDSKVHAEDRGDHIPSSTQPAAEAAGQLQEHNVPVKTLSSPLSPAPANDGSLTAQKAAIKTPERVTAWGQLRLCDLKLASQPRTPASPMIDSVTRATGSHNLNSSVTEANKVAQDLATCRRKGDLASNQEVVQCAGRKTPEHSNQVSRFGQVFWRAQRSYPAASGPPGENQISLLSITSPQPAPRDSISYAIRQSREGGWWQRNFDSHEITPAFQPQQNKSIVDRRHFGFGDVGQKALKGNPTMLSFPTSQMRSSLATGSPDSESLPLWLNDLRLAPNASSLDILASVASLAARLPDRTAAPGDVLSQPSMVRPKENQGNDLEVYRFELTYGRC
ncbi:hypothetical protein I317_01322 [Kwoniella heveanensis CBS 569]|nr:hypothetical protein I317_01322 [Kwoniella heveanensis CBS 569]